MYYGLIGTIFCSLFCTITTLNNCGDSIISHKEMIKICRLRENITQNETYNYYDNYHIYIDHLLEGDILYKIKNYCIVLLRIIILFLVRFSSILIIKYLNPAFFICASYIYYFVLRLSMIISNIFIFTEETEDNFYLDFFIEIFSILGILVYVEFLELNFCDLNYNLKKNIMLRSMLDSKGNIDETEDITEDNDDQTISRLSKNLSERISNINKDHSLFE
jgi:hypothetical protein